MRMRHDPDLLPKITQLSDQHGVNAADVIALLAISALAVSDMSGLAFWADLSETTCEEFTLN